jgi:hypothetical protein
VKDIQLNIYYNIALKLREIWHVTHMGCWQPGLESSEREAFFSLGVK